MTNDIVKIVNRIPFIDSRFPKRAYVVAFVAPQDDNNLVEPTEEDIAVASVYRNSLINRFTTPRERYEITQNPDFDECGGLSCVLFMKDANLGWRYRKSTWQNNLELFPQYDSRFKIDTLRELVDFIERDTLWWDDHQELI